MLADVGPILVGWETIWVKSKHKIAKDETPGNVSDTTGTDPDQLILGILKSPKKHNGERGNCRTRQRSTSCNFAQKSEAAFGGR